MLPPLFAGRGRLKETYASLRGRTGGSGSNADTAAAEAMPGPGAKDAKTLPKATRKDSELHGAAIKPELGLWH